MNWYVVNNDSYLMHHGIKGQRWGVKNGPPYPLSSEKVAKKVYNDASRNIKQILSDVVQAANRSGSKLYGLENKQKTEQSINRKLNKISHEEGLTFEDAAKQIRDAIRFTTLSSEKDYVDNYEQFKKSLENKGYTETRCKNYFTMFKEGKVKHKSVQSTFKTKDGYEFEVQFHTGLSQDAKNKKIPLYEEVRQEGISKKRVAEIEKQMYDLALNVKDPLWIDEIKSHS